MDKNTTSNEPRKERYQDAFDFSYLGYTVVTSEIKPKKNEGVELSKVESEKKKIIKNIDETKAKLNKVTEKELEYGNQTHEPTKQKAMVGNLMRIIRTSDLKTKITQLPDEMKIENCFKTKVDNQYDPFADIIRSRVNAMKTQDESNTNEKAPARKLKF
jgi:hypothetical protein